MYPIVGGCDERYAAHLMVAFLSVLENTSSQEKLHFFCLDGGLVEKTKARMQTIVRSYGSNLDFLIVDENLLQGISLEGRITLPAYYRLFIADLLGSRYKKAVYLDCDMVVKADIVEVFAYDISSLSHAAVINFSRSAYKGAGVAREKYFNSGFLLLNLDYWLSYRLARKIIELRLEKPIEINHADQGVMNAVLFDSWLPLPLKWNHQTALYKKHHQQEAIDRYGAEQLDEANRRPAIIHFLGEDKPWNTYCFHPLAGEYHRYRAILEEKEPAFASSKTHQKGMLEWIRFWCSASRLKKLWRQKKWQRWYQRIGYSLYKPE